MGNSASTIASTLVTKDEANAKYQPKGSYLTPDGAAGTYLAAADAKNTYLATADAKNTYLSVTDAKNTYLASVDAKNTYLASADANNIFLPVADAPKKTLWCADGSCKVPTGSKQIAFPSGDTTQLGKPSATGSAGARVVLWGDGTKFFYGAGVDSNTLWMSTDTPDGVFKFYNQDKEVANISGAGISAATFTATGEVVTPKLTASGQVVAGSVTTAGDVVTQGSVNAKNVVASGAVTAPNLYDKTGVDSAISKATQNIVSSGQAANLSTMDINPKSVNSQGTVAVPRGSTVRLSGPSDPVHSMGFASAYGLTNVEGPFIAGWQGAHPSPYRGALGTIGNNNGAPATPNVAMYWDAAANATFPNQVRAGNVRVGNWMIRENSAGFLEFVRVNPDGTLVNGNKSNVGYIAFTGDGNINLRRYAKDDDYGSGYLADQFVRYDRPFALQSSKGGYLSDQGGWKPRPQALNYNETMVPRKPFGANFQPIADDKPFSDTSELFKLPTTTTPTTTTTTPTTTTSTTTTSTTPITFSSFGGLI